MMEAEPAEEPWAEEPCLAQQSAGALGRSGESRSVRSLSLSVVTLSL